ncbi:tRNA uridine-5-carboxymethylaminomethyl(34) synthesis GTPase MnmE [Arachidicoccus terrestris]|uniref:tRNA uridine-5-carboxymethylaminomethyl(34) synthesis GTPase MnmE n=1 Tax=Arachidicoccus terrestris TaxID=2875539 RepID=UPI001CC7810C|nr:tRNA uridine-5-carboxymethylaminomethyl(34) synthesis GTPase MnmE [Arachidicoccus terrestris]UAY55786.1 tRNA uridine-5-carboxymethylaminomethyl(34) synthesis GTPase MnmE [Arachidicoccus terrestris]
MSHLPESFLDTIVAIATPQGAGALGIIRISGPETFAIVNALFAGKDLSRQKTHTLHFGVIRYQDEVIDEVVISLFRNPRSYTGEDVIEISCHGSAYIQQRLLQVLVASGARMARPGEFTERAFFNGKMDLTQAEAVADLIASNSKAAQQTALKQLRGGFSEDLQKLREELIHFAALIELELDFSEEDVEFADRSQFMNLISQIKSATQKLIDSFQLGNVIKNGVRVAIIGRPNAGKSTLLNALLNEERAIVSDIAGTTRDTIEETLNINGILFRLIDTAGIREHSSDHIENLGIERSKSNAENAHIILYLVDSTTSEPVDVDWMQPYQTKTIKVFNKMDAVTAASVASVKNPDGQSVCISAKKKTGIEDLKQLMYLKAVGEELQTENTIVTNARHHAILLKIAESLEDIQMGMENQVTGDLLAIDIRRCLHFLGEITGKIEVDRDILGTIFGKFCIGK